MNEERKKKVEDPRVLASNVDVKQFKDETEEEKKERWGYPEYDPKNLLEEFELKDSIPMLEENGIDNELFWQLDEGNFKDKLKVENFGTLKQIMLRHTDIWE